jgi:ribosomal protein L10
MTMADDYKARVRAEETELADRYQKLLAFFDTPIWEGLPLVEKTDIRKQAHHMGGYLAALRNRIARF